MAGTIVPASTVVKGSWPILPTEQQLPSVIRALPFLIAALLVTTVCLYPPLRTGPVFNTPDETSNYLAAREFGEHGTLYYENELTRVDEENLLHSRGFITHQGRAVPMQFLGHPFFWGCTFKLFGPRAWLFVPLLLGLFFIIYLHRLFRLAAPTAAPVLFLFAFAATPLIYLLGRPFLSASLATVLTVPTFYHAIRYGRTRSTTQLLLCSAFLSLALFARPDNLPLALPALYLLISHAAGTVFNRSVLRDIALFALVFTVLFVIPVLVLNQLTYGSPLTYGYHLVDQAYGLRDAPTPELAGWERLLRSARNLVFPFDVSLTAALSGLFKYFILLTPLLALAALIRANRLVLLLGTPGRRWRTAAVLILAGYLVISRASGNLHGMGNLTPNILDSLARYLMPLYLILLVASWKNLDRLKRPRLQAATALLALGLGMYGLFLQWDQSYVTMTRTVRKDVFVTDRVLRKTEPDAVIYCGLRDKYLVPHRTVAAWWETGSGSAYDPHLLARSATRVLDLGRAAYLEDRKMDLDELRSVLAQNGLKLVKQEHQMNLYEIVKLPPVEREPAPDASAVRQSRASLDTPTGGP